MKNIETLIENFFSKKENILTESDLKEYVEKQFLTEEVFNSVKLVQYYDKWINQIENQLPFIVSDEDGEKKQVIIDKSFIDTLKQLNKDFTAIKDYFSPRGKYAKVIPGADGNKYSLNQFEKEVFTGKSVSVADLKEGLVAYFYSILSNKKGQQEVDNLVTALTTDKKVKVSLPLEVNIENVKIGSELASVLGEIKKANAGSYNAQNSYLLLNAVSCALGMDQLLKSTNSIIVDKVDSFNKIKAIARQITAGDPNKWNPSDLYIYPASFLPTIDKVLGEVQKTNALVSTAEGGEGKQTGLNELFSESEKSKIVGVSLKEEKAQYGKALGITKHAAALLNSKDIEQYNLEPESKKMILAISTNTVSVEDKAILEQQKKLKQQKIKAMNLLKGLGVLKVQISDMGLSESIDNLNFIEEIKLLSEAGLKFSNLIDRKYKDNFFKKITNQEPFTLISGESAIIDPKVLPTLSAAGTNVEKIKTAFRAGFPTTDGRVINLGSFDAASLASKEQTKLPTAPPVKTNYVNKEVDKTQADILDKLIKKYECYRFLEIFIRDFDKIKMMNSVLSTYKNPLLALTAYAVGLGGFNPTFYKVQAISDGSPAKITKFEGQEKLNMAANEATLEDFDNYAGFKFIFVTEMGLSEVGQPKLFQTSLNFKFKGSAQMSVEVYEFKEK
jgi:hypothetical protein